MSNCSPNSISPSSSGGEFKPDMNAVISGLNRSPAHATSVPSHHCAVSPQDEASNDGLKNNKQQKYYFTSTMANEAVADMNFENLVSWYLKKKEQATFGSSNSTNGSDRKRKGANATDSSDMKRAKEATTINDIQKIGKIESRDDNPLKKMERMSTSQALEGSGTGIKDVVTSSCTKNKEAERERNAKLEKLGEIESTLVSPQPSNYPGIQRQTSDPHLKAPNAGKDEWERLVGSGSGPSTSTAPLSQCPPAQSSPIYPPPAAPLSAGAYPNIYTQYPPMGMQIPNGSGKKSSNSCSVNAAMSPRMITPMQAMYAGYPPYPGWRPGMSGYPPMPPNGAYPQWHPQAMPKGVGNLSPGAFHMNPAMGGPPLQPGMTGYPPHMLAAGGRMPPPYGYPQNMPPQPGYQPPPGTMHPGMMMPRPGMPMDPSFNSYPGYQPIQSLEKDTSKGSETSVPDPVVAAS